MAFLVLEFAFKFFDLLAWHLFGSGFPVYASIRAIENNSNSDMRNLVAYWIIFSLISLFELEFVKLIDWLPFWPYMKLMAVCWLVLPDFHGASYVYDLLLRPCFFVYPRVVIKYLIKPKEYESLSAKNFLAVAERYVQENGSEALEKLLNLKHQSKHTQPGIGVEEIKAITNTEEKETASAIQSKNKEPGVANEDASAVELSEKNSVAATESSNHAKPDIGVEEIMTIYNTDEKETAAAIQSENKEPNVTKEDARAAELPEKNSASATKLSKVEESKVAKENANVWVPKDKNPAVATEQSKVEESKVAKENANVWVPKDKNPAVATEQSNHAKPDIGVEEIMTIYNTDEKETAAAIQSENKEPNVTKEDARAAELPEKNSASATKLSKVEESKVAKENANVWVPKDKNPAVATEQIKCVVSNLAQNEKKKVGAGEIKESTMAAAGGANKATDSEIVQKEWTCALCQVITTNEKTMESHFQGRKHRKKCEGMKASKQVN